MFHASNSNVRNGRIRLYQTASAEILWKTSRYVQPDLVIAGDADGDLLLTAHVLACFLVCFCVIGVIRIIGVTGVVISLATTGADSDGSTALRSDMFDTSGMSVRSDRSDSASSLSDTSVSHSYACVPWLWLNPSSSASARSVSCKQLEQPLGMTSVSGVVTASSKMAR
ncbi:hypothetical protein DFJ77DRAFT_449051 [Powellomyces hirtus]|nr:hypothetical protein DFJ77DRAFT_449051 [Powellomyces hirtus]